MSTHVGEISPVRMYKNVVNFMLFFTNMTRKSNFRSLLRPKLAYDPRWTIFLPWTPITKLLELQLIFLLDFLVGLLVNCT